MTGRSDSTADDCQQLGAAELIDYAAGELTAAEAAAIEAHLFACADCGARAAQLEALMRAIPPAVRSAAVGGFVTDAVLNQLAREGVRVRSYALSPGASVRCAVWEDDEVMALRLRADFGGATEVSLSQRIAGAEVVHATGPVTAGGGEIIYAIPAAWVRQLPEVELDVLIFASDAAGASTAPGTRGGGDERAISRYRLVHEGALHR